MSTLSSTVLNNASDALRTLFADVRKSAGCNQVVFRAMQEEVLDMLFRAFSVTANNQSRIDSAEALNEMVRFLPGKTLLEALEDEFFEMLIRRKLDIADYLKPNTMGFEQIEFFRSNFLDVELGITELRKLADGKRVNPAVRGCLGGRSIFNDTPEKIVEVAMLRDPFAQSRIFRFHHQEFLPCNLKSQPPEKFFGFHGVRSVFAGHLSDFASGQSNVPLLISSLPGLGKTQMSIAYTLAEPELTLILAEPETLSQELETLIARLALRKRRKFVVFFDDIEPDKVDWYGFRTNVGGSAALPENITFILASNYHFPINILSRGREVTFPVFDEVRCLEMVEDFLIDFGMKNGNENLASVIGAGFIEDFGQKKFTELSPRTLMRYLEKFRHDAALRRKMLEQSRQEMIIRPDAQLFYEFNIKLLRQLYGESYIDDLREERLRNLERA
ncbi:MAG: glycosyltransferase family 4 protein [Lentisphaerae bacterium]|nr:glycosyltransferase family 4 protein [Lentisphaerota bacterium]